MRKLVVAISSVLFAGSALAGTSVASLNVTNGSVLVNQGKQFLTAQPSQVLAAGDRVMVMEGGNATVKYTDGCILTLSSGSLVVIPLQSMCATGINKVTQISPLTAQVPGDNEPDCDNDGTPDKTDSDIDGDKDLNDVDDDDYTDCKVVVGALTTNNTGILIASGLAVAVAAVSLEDDATLSP